MEKYEVTFITEINQGKISGEILLKAIVWANTEEQARNMGDNIYNSYQANSNYYKAFPVGISYGISVTKVQ
tara:strand:- start:286 stop:498 length:213 start_codon:yes stop_codon:yes gene_type:complete